MPLQCPNHIFTRMRLSWYAKKGGKEASGKKDKPANGGFTCLFTCFTTKTSWLFHPTCGRQLANRKLLLFGDSPMLFASQTCLSGKKQRQSPASAEAASPLNGQTTQLQGKTARITKRAALLKYLTWSWKFTLLRC